MEIVKHNALIKHASQVAERRNLTFVVALRSMSHSVVSYAMETRSVDRKLLLLPPIKKSKL
jgi:hypothetical protein